MTDGKRLTIELGAAELQALEEAARIARRAAFVSGCAVGALAVLLIESFFI